jgi:putative beta-lysine N-acetyltransferase
LIDEVQSLGGSQIQHGPFSDRVYALRLAASDMPEILDDLEELSVERGYGKIVVKARESHLGELEARGFRVEATIPELFGTGENGLFAGKFLDPQRAVEPRIRRVKEVLEVARREGVGGAPSNEPWTDPTEVDTELELREAEAEDVEAVASCYRSVFESYPFPIHDPEFIENALDEGTRFFTVWDGESLVAASSMEPGGAPGAVEMTDFATLPSHRGRGLATALLRVMDGQARDVGLRLAYTIARSVSFGMNITFARRSYRYAGTLVNNTQIAGSIESMNVWFKSF